MRSLQMTVSARSERRKGSPLRKRANKDIFRCLNTIWSIGIARRGLNELIFCENLKFDQNQHLSLLLPVTLKISSCAFRLILPAMGRGSGGGGALLRSGTNMTWATKKIKISSYVCTFIH